MGVQHEKSFGNTPSHTEHFIISAVLNDATEELKVNLFFIVYTTVLSKIILHVTQLSPSQSYCRHYSFFLPLIPPHSFQKRSNYIYLTCCPFDMHNRASTRGQFHMHS